MSWKKATSAATMRARDRGGEQVELADEDAVDLERQVVDAEVEAVDLPCPTAICAPPSMT